MDLKFGKGFSVDQVNDQYVINHDPDSTEEVVIKDADPSKLVAGLGVTFITSGDEITVTLSEQPGKKITKDMAEKAIEKKGLRVKAEDNHIECSTHLSLKAGREKTRESYRPTPRELELINELALEPQTETSGYVFELLSSSTDYDRSYERMDNKAINDMVKMTPGKPFFLDHNWNTKSTMGRMIKAKNEGGKLIQWAYVPENSKTKEFIEEILNGNLNRLSVGFAIDYKDFECDVCHKSVFDYECEHYPGYEDEKGNMATATIKRVKDYYETSAAPVPCNPVAGVRKGIAPGADERTLSNEYITVSAVESLSGEITISNPELEETLIKLAAEIEALKEKEKSSLVTIENDNTIQDNIPVELENKELEVAPGEEEVTSAPEVKEESPAEESSVDPEGEEESTPPEAPGEKSTTQEVNFLEVLTKLNETLEGLKSKVDELDKKVDEQVVTKTSLHDLLKNEEPKEVKVEKSNPSRDLLSMFSLNFGLEDQE